MRTFVVLAGMLLVCSLGVIFDAGIPAYAEVFYAKDEALERAFPGAEEVLTHTFVLTATDLAAVAERAKVPVDLHLFTFFEGRKNGESMGYAAIDNEIVRTLPQTFMVVVNPDGSIRTTFVLAFHEPLEYLPPEGWLKQFDGRRGGGDPTENISGILGSTLSVQSITIGVRRVLALYDILLGASS
jgi:hypothetical protein